MRAGLGSVQLKAMCCGGVREQGGAAGVSSAYGGWGVMGGEELICERKRVSG